MTAGTTAGCGIGARTCATERKTVEIGEKTASIGEKIMSIGEKIDGTIERTFVTVGKTIATRGGGRLCRDPMTTRGYVTMGGVKVVAASVKGANIARLTRPAFDKALQAEDREAEVAGEAEAAVDRL